MEKAIYFLHMRNVAFYSEIRNKNTDAKIMALP
jgi:hypothetical protein